MEVIRMSEVPVFTAPTGISARKLLNRPSFLIMNLLLAPGEAVEKHNMPDDAFFYVVKGSGIIEVGEEQTGAGETDIVFCPKDTPRGLKASPDQEFHVLVVRRPV